jgi:serine/threonine protein kinase
MTRSGLIEDPLLASVPVVEGYKLLGGVVLYQKIGQGGMGAVYRGRHLRLNVDVAVKVMVPPPGLTGTEADDFVKRFIREAQTAAAVRHPNLIRVYDVNSEGGTYYLVMDFVDGESAADRLKRKAKPGGSGLTEIEACEICLGAAAGLAAAHRKGIVHRDVKPDNILIDADGHIVVADLGLAKAFAKSDGTDARTMGLSVSMQAIGTPYYMSPEQSKSARDVDPRSDVWSLGVTLYRLLCGLFPWYDSDYVELVSLIRKEPVPDLRALGVTVSEDACAIIGRALAKPPDERYADASAMQTELKRHVNRISEGVSGLLADPEAVGAKELAVEATPPRSDTLTLIGRKVLGGESLPFMQPTGSNTPYALASQARPPAEAPAPAAPVAPPAAGGGIPVVGEEALKLKCSGRVASLAYSPSGGLLAAGCDDSRVYVWRPADGSLVSTLKPSAGGVWSVCFSGDSRRLAVGCEQRIAIVYDTDGWDEAVRLDEGHRGSVASIAFSPDRIHLASGGSDRAAILWDGQFGLALKTLLGHEMPVWSVAFSPDGRTLAVGSEDSTVSFWGVPTGEKTAVIDTGLDAILSLSYSADGTMLATGRGGRDGSGKGSVVIWDVDTGEALNTIWGHESSVRSVAFSPDGNRIATGSSDSTVALWDVASGEKLHTYSGHESWVRSVTFSPDGACITSGGSDKTVRVWNAKA